VVLVTQGTVATNSDQLIAPTLRALANEDLLVIATTGGKPVDSVNVHPLPANARVETFLSYHHLMPHVDAMVTNAGYGSVQLALAHGIPLVAAGGTEEKPEICARIAWRGVGINLKTKTPGEERIRDAVRRVLNDPRYRMQAQEVQADFARHDPPTEAAVLLERQAETRRPVLRTA
jgi:UDP:flavonoid glycosyltransferase YjiC (YdhE family)